MERFLPAFHPYTVCAGPTPDSGWGKRDGRLFIPQGLNYLELCKAILAQAHPNVLFPLRKAITKECGVQVNAKVDKIVQCSLGPKTLFCSKGGILLSSKSPRSPDLVKAEGTAPYCTTPVSNLRFLRPVSIYSPVFDRRISMKQLSDADAGEGEAERTVDHLESGHECETGHSGEEDKGMDFKTTFHRSTKGSNFQFLEQRYGFFHCKKCNIRWESAYVWCISGTSKVYYKQLCRKCQVGFNPYRVESILCKGCSQTSCNCEKRQRHINMKRPHRQALCCRCKGMRLSCDATYSFKYIV